MSKSPLSEFISLPNSSSSITVSIRVGNEQMGTITFNVSGESMIQKEGSLSYTESDSNNLSGKSFDFNIVCTDVNVNSDNLVVTVDLIGVDNSGPWSMSKKVSSGGTYQFFGSIEFM